MSKSISFRDLLKASWLSHYNEIELLDISKDEEVAKVLDIIGITYPVEYYAAKHADMTGKVAVGFIAVGDVSRTRKHLTSAYASLTDVLVASAYEDTSLTEALGELTGLSRKYDGCTKDEPPDGDIVDITKCPDQLEPKSECEANEQEIAQLNSIRDMIRGPMHNAAGRLKSRAEYQDWKAEQQLIMEKYDC